MNIRTIIQYTFYWMPRRNITVVVGPIFYSHVNLSHPARIPASPEAIHFSPRAGFD